MAPAHFVPAGDVHRVEIAHQPSSAPIVVEAAGYVSADPAELAVLRAYPFVDEAGEAGRDVLERLSRAQLEKVARDLLVPDADQLPNKPALVAAILGEPVEQPDGDPT